MSVIQVRHTRLVLCVVVMTAVQPNTAHAATAGYASMAPLWQYLIGDRLTEVNLARSAAPPSISGHATILVLTRSGYQVAAKGSNGFTCLVERAWTKSFDDAEFWDPKLRSPVCYNAEASNTVLPYTLKRTEMVLAGLSETTIHDRIVTAVANKNLPSTAPGSMAYMMSKHQNLTEAQGSWMSHVMVYAPKADGAGDGASWGADLASSPVLFDNAHHANPEPWAVFFVPVAHWSDGSTAPLMH